MGFDLIMRHFQVPHVMLFAGHLMPLPLSAFATSARSMLGRLDVSDSFSNRLNPHLYSQAKRYVLIILEVCLDIGLKWSLYILFVTKKMTGSFMRRWRTARNRLSWKRLAATTHALKNHILIHFFILVTMRFIKNNELSCAPKSTQE